MYKNHDNQHMIDILFVLSLFGIFAVSAVIVILFGANIYQNTVTQMDHNYTARTSIAYITEKIHQADSSDAIQIYDKDGTQILMLTDVTNDIPYATSLYEYNGWLYELFARTDIELPLDAGQPIMEIKNLTFMQHSSSLLEVSFCDADGDNTTVYISTHSDPEVRHE